MFFCVKWGIRKEKMRDFRLNGGLAKIKRVIFVKCWILEEKTRGFRVKRGILEEKTRDFRVEWGICEEKSRDFCLNGGFAKRKRVIFA